MNDDLISREAVGYYIQSYIHEIITESGTDKNEHTNSILRAILNGIKTMPSVTPKARWIPVKKELPEIDRYVLVHLTDIYYSPIQIMSLHLRESTEVDYEWNIYWKTQEESIEFDVEDVIAWMPLPHPYKAESGE